MTDAQINGLLIFAFVFALAGAVALWMTLSLRRHRGAGMIGGLTTAMVVAGAAATWKLRHGGSGPAALAAGGLGLVRALIFFLGADARVKIGLSVFPPARRAGSPSSHFGPKDFSEPGPSRSGFEVQPRAASTGNLQDRRPVGDGDRHTALQDLAAGRPRPFPRAPNDLKEGLLGLGVVIVLWLGWGFWNERQEGPRHLRAVQFALAQQGFGDAIVRRKLGVGCFGKGNRGYVWHTARLRGYACSNGRVSGHPGRRATKVRVTGPAVVRP